MLFRNGPTLFLKVEALRTAIPIRINVVPIASSEVALRFGHIRQLVGFLPFSMPQACGLATCFIST